jgi:hypothetical protein
MCLDHIALHFMRHSSMSCYISTFYPCPQVLTFSSTSSFSRILQRGCCSFSVRGRHRLRESLVFLITLRSITRANTSTVR